MKSILTGLIAMVLLGLGTVACGQADNNYKAVFAKHWRISKAFTLSVAEAMPAESYGFKPTAEEMSFGQLMIHIAEANSEAFANVAGTKALVEPSEADKRAIIKFIADSFDKCGEEFDAMTTAQLDRMMDITGGRKTTAREVLWWAFTNAAHHRGQAEVYLRLKGIRPPRYEF